MTVEILFVCTGNVCRSPLAERLLQARLVPALAGAVTVSSAGTRALAGYAMDAASGAVLREFGGNPEGHVARQFRPGLADAADLVLTADGGNRTLALSAAPAALARTFTIREFARLGADPPRRGLAADEAEVRARLAAVAARRGLGLPAEPGADDIGDPFGAPSWFVRQCVQQIATGIDVIGRALGVLG